MKKIFAIVVVAMATMVSGINSNAQEVKKESPWVEVQVVDIPFGYTVFTGVTKNGNPKAWFEFGDLKVTVSPKAYLGETFEITVTSLVNLTSGSDTLTIGGKSTKVSIGKNTFNVSSGNQLVDDVNMGEATETSGISNGLRMQTPIDIAHRYLDVSTTLGTLTDDTDFPLRIKNENGFIHVYGAVNFGNELLTSYNEVGIIKIINTMMSCIL